MRERLVKDALKYLDSLAGEAQGDPALQRELAAAYERVGEVRGGGESGSLGDGAGARESYAKSLSIREALVAANPNDLQARRDYATSHQKIGFLLRETAEASLGLEHLWKAHAVYLKLFQEYPANKDVHFDLIDTYNKLGRALRQRGNLAGALDQYRAALALGENFAASLPEEQRYRRGLWTSYLGVAQLLFMQKERPGTLDAHNKAVALGEALLAEDPINADYRRGLVLTYQTGGDYRRHNDPEGALNDFRRAAALDEELLVADPANAVTRKDLGYQHKRIADFLANREDWSQALLYFGKALEAYQKVVTDAPADLISRFLIATCRAGAGAMHARLGELGPARKECDQATVLLEEIKEDRANSHQRSNRVQAYEYLGYAYFALAESPEMPADERPQHMRAAREMFQSGLQVLDDMRDRDIFDSADEDYVKVFAGEIAKCDAALAK